jgi:uncharacterized membrane protein YphA (DoxX/SURF4 family)
MAREPESGLLATIQGTTDWGVLLLLRVVVSLPLLFFGVLHLVSPDVLREVLVTAGMPLVYLHSVLVPLVEVLAGVLLLVGFLTRLGAVLAFGVMVPAILVTLQVKEGGAGAALPAVALPVTVAVASFFLALLGGGPGSIDERMYYQRAISRDSSQTTAGPRGFFPWSASDTVAIVLGLLILGALMYLVWGRPMQRESSHAAARAHFARTIELARAKTDSAHSNLGQAPRHKRVVAKVAATSSNKENNRCL